MKFKDLPIGVPCGLKGVRGVFCRFAPSYGPGMVFVMGQGSQAHISEFGGETCMERDDYGIINPYGEIET